MKKFKNTVEKIFDPAYILLFLVVAAVSILCVYTERIQNIIYEKNIDISGLVSKDYTVSEGYNYTQTGGDPRLWIPCTDREINTITIGFSSPIEEAREARVYWAVDETGALNETNAFNIRISEESLLIDISMPQRAVYTNIRFDCPSEFVLDSVTLKNIETSVETQFRFLPFLLVSILSLAAGILYTIFKRKISSFFFSFFKFKHKVRNSRFKTLKKPLYSLFFIIFIVTIIFSITIHKDYLIKDGKAIDLLSVSYRGYDVNSNFYTVISEDPRIVFQPKSTIVKNVLVKFAEPITYSGKAQLFYNIDGNFNENNSVLSRFEKGDNNIFFEIPKGEKCISLRVDIDGEFALSEIITGNVYEEKAQIQIAWLNIIVVLIIFAFVVFVTRRFSSQISSIKDKITDKPFSHSEKYLKKLSNLYLTLSICFGVLIIFLSPPGAQADETVHNRLAYLVSNGDFFVDIDDQGNLGNMVRDDIINLPLYRYTEEMGIFTYDIAHSLYKSQVSQNHVFFEQGVYSPIGHLVSGFGIAAFRLLGLNMSAYTEAIIGKICNLIFSSVLISISIKKSKALNNTMFLLAIMPMTLYQCASLSYDSVIISCSMLFFAYLNKIYLSDKNYKLIWEDILAICISLFFLIGAKSGGYATAIIILLSIGVRKFGNLKKYFSCINLVILIAIVSFLIPTAINNNISQAAGAVKDELAVQQSIYLSNNLDRIPELIQNTLEVHGKVYWEGFIGRLGWQTKDIPYPFVIIYSFCLLISFASEVCVITNVKTGLRFLTVAACTTTFIALFISMYLGYSYGREGVGSSIIAGVQGRYFIPIALFAMIIFANPLLRNLKHIDKVMAVENQMVKISGICSGAITIFVLLTGYWLPAQY